MLESLNSFTISKPVRPGRLQSKRMRSYFPVLASSSPLRPSLAESTSKPALFKAIVRERMIL